MNRGKLMVELCKQKQSIPLGASSTGNIFILLAYNLLQAFINILNSILGAIVDIPINNLSLVTKNSVDSSQGAQKEENLNNNEIVHRNCLTLNEGKIFRTGCCRH